MANILKTPKNLPQSEVKTVESLLNELTNIHTQRPINLNPVYQRGECWQLKQKQAYMLSLWNGHQATVIVFSKKETETVCVDGKQRLLTIRDYYNNLFSFIYEVGEDSYEIYYSKKPEKSEPHVLCMTPEQRCALSDRKLYTTYYCGLNYDDECAIFGNIQNGIPLSHGQILLSRISDEHAGEHLKKYCSEKQHIFTNYTKQTDIVTFITMLLYIINKDNAAKPTKPQYTKYIQKFKTLVSLNNELKILTPVIDNICVKVMMNSKIIPINLTQQAYLTFVHTIRTHWDTDFDADKQKLIIQLVVDTWKFIRNKHDTDKNYDINNVDNIIDEFESRKEIKEQEIQDAIDKANTIKLKKGTIKCKPNK